MFQLIERNPVEFEPTWVDISISVIFTLFVPFVLGWLYESTGAFIPLLIYYGLFCVVVVLWRKGSLEYSLPKNLDQIKAIFTPLFIGFFVFEIVRAIVSSFTIISVPASEFDFLGFVFTLIIWSFLNGIMEQLSWIYVFDSWFFFKKDQISKVWRTLLAFGVYFIVIMNIHLFFWVDFLWESEFVFPWSPLLIASQFVLASGYLLLYKEQQNMFPVSLVHIFVDVTAVLFARYSILPYLFML